MLLTSMLLCWPLLDELPVEPDVPPEKSGICCCADGKLLTAVFELALVGAHRVADERGGDEEARDRERGERGAARLALVASHGTRRHRRGGRRCRRVRRDRGRCDGRRGGCGGAAGAGGAGGGAAGGYIGWDGGVDGACGGCGCVASSSGCDMVRAPGVQGDAGGGTRTRDSAEPFLRGTCSRPRRVPSSATFRLVPRSRSRGRPDLRQGHRRPPCRPPGAVGGEVDLVARPHLVGLAVVDE